MSTNAREFINGRDASENVPTVPTGVRNARRFAPTRPLFLKLVFARKQRHPGSSTLIRA